jgi:hypothetical protein
LKKEIKTIPTTLVTPVAAAEKRALSEYKEEKKTKNPSIRYTILPKIRTESDRNFIFS